jgi:hypothetical protein
MTEQTATTATSSAPATTALAQVKPSFIDTAPLTGYSRSQVATVHLDEGNDLAKANAAAKEIKAALDEPNLTVTVELNHGPNGDQAPTAQIRVTRYNHYIDTDFADALNKAVAPKYKARAAGAAEIVFTDVVIRMTVTKGTLDTDRNVVNNVDGVHKSRITKDYDGRTVIKFTVSRAKFVTALRDDNVQELVDTVAGNVAEKLGLHVTKPISVTGIDNDELLFTSDDED